MKRMITAGLTAALAATAPGTEAAELTAKKVAKIAKRVFDAQIRALEPVVGGDTTVGHAATAGRAATAGHADTAGHATTAGRAETAARADTVGHASTADRAVNADRAVTAGSAATAEFAGTAESANPMAYAFVHTNGQIDPERSFGFEQVSVYVDADDEDYCFSGLRPKIIQVTVEREDTLNGPQPPLREWNSTGYQELPPPPLTHPVIVASLGAGNKCPAGTEFRVRAFNATDGRRGFAAFFVSLVL